MPSFPAVMAANTFIERYSESGEIDHLKLQKLVYYSYGWWLALRPNDPPFVDSKPQVWKLGPVFRPIYSAFASNRDQVIREMKPIGPFNPARSIGVGEALASELIVWIWEKYGGLNGIQLSNMTHEPGTPWYTIAKKNNFSVPKFLEMPDDENRAYFHKLAVAEGIIAG